MLALEKMKKKQSHALLNAWLRFFKQIADIVNQKLSA